MSPKAVPQSPFSYIKRKRAVRNASKPTAIEKITSRPYINPQIASPLFSLLPAEIRQHIFQYALLSHKDLSKPYSRHSFWYRPGYTHARTIAINLLLTCRRIYLETDLLPLTQNEHTVWGVESSRVPPFTSSYLLNGSMNLSQRNAIQYVHFFMQQFWLEDWRNRWLAYSQSWPEGCPPRLRITIRHTDWWYNLLGENSPLALDPKRKGRAKVADWVGEDKPFEPGSWGQRFEYMKGLEIFELELETLETKRGELDVIIGRTPTWRFPLGDGRVLFLDEKATVRDAWTGSKHFKGINVPSVQPGLQLRQGSTASFSGLSKKRVNSLPDEELGPGDMLDYYVVTLIWRARDPSENNDAKEMENDTSGLPVIHSANVVAAAGPITASQVTFNRMNAVPTFYG